MNEKTSIMVANLSQSVTYLMSNIIIRYNVLQKCLKIQNHLYQKICMAN